MGGQPEGAPVSIRANENFVLRRLYVDNFRSLVNFELKLGQVNLLMGGNGSGKSSVFAALTALRRVVQGEAVGEVLPAGSCTRWQTRPVQVFELEVDCAGAVFRYRVEVVHHNGRTTIGQETLEVDGASVYSRVRENVELIGYDVSDETWTRGTELVVTWHWKVLGPVGDDVPADDAHDDTSAVFMARSAAALASAWGHSTMALPVPITVP